VAIGMVKTDYWRPGDSYEIAILGQPHHAVLLDKPPFDPEGVRLRS
jgi:dimethylglycine dehydrogenase